MVIVYVNFYIFFIIYGFNCDEMGVVDYDKLKKNFEIVLDVYISCCDKVLFVGF